MVFDRFINRFRSKTPRAEPIGCDWIDSAADFGHVIERERMRADRSGKMCSLAVFTLPVRDDNKTLRRFTEILQPRLRATDHVGWMGETTLGVMLWDTSAIGATRFIDTLHAQCDFADGIATEVFTYPTHQSPADRKRKCSTDEPSPPVEKDSIPRVAGVGAESSERSPRCQTGWGLPAVDPSHPEASQPTDSGGDRPVQPLEMLFVRPLPMWKRAIDIIGATAGLVLLAPLLLVTALLIKLTSSGPVFFRQLRDGLAGEQFTIYKFRTMTVDAETQKARLRRHSEQDGPAFKMTHDPRVTPLGRYLRKTCLDEFPQLWNVLKGDMTLVGPRPLDSREAEHISGWGRRRIEVTPGLTCIWQVHGKSKVSFAEWMRMDIRYLNRRTLWQDAVLIVQTAVAVLLHRGSC